MAKSSAHITAPVEQRNLSIEQTARALGVGKTSIYVLIRTNELRAIRIGDRQLVPVAEIERFIAARLAAS